MTKEVGVKALLSGVAALAVVVAAAGAAPAERASQPVPPPASAFLPEGMFGPSQLVFFGYVRSLTRKGSGWVARVDPSLILTGVTATAAAVEDKVLRPGEAVPNDYYERNETHRLLTYRVPANAHVSVLVNPGTGPRPVVVPVSELAQIVRGKNPRRRPGLWGPASGYWIRTQSDRVLAVDQPYRP